MPRNLNRRIRGTHTGPAARRKRGWRRLLVSRRGVVSVLSMMFVILFGSLAAAMAVMTRSNITTAATHQHVMRAMGAAETGLSIAEHRLTEAAGRFLIERGTVDGQFGKRLWSGSYTSGDGIVQVLPPRSYSSTSLPSSLAEALAEVHLRDLNTIPVNGIAAPTIADNPIADPNEYYIRDWVRTPAVALYPQQPGTPSGVAFSIEYMMLANGTDVRAVVTGYDFDYQVRGEPLTRRIVQDFTVVKRVNAAVLSPSKIMIGKNVMIEGDLGALYTDVSREFGDPLIMKSDFWGLDPNLDAELTRLFNALADYDVDKDNRLRVDHPIERQGIPDFSNLGYPGTSADVTQDGYVDEFDIFIMFFDADRDGQVVLSTELTDGTPAEGRSPEFTLDDDLALLIDSSRPDRNNNGVYKFIDNNNNGRFDPGIDELVDIEYVDITSVPNHLQSYIHNHGGSTVLYRDQVLGFRDGVIDRRDQYAKVTGRLVFRVSENQWIAGQGADYMKRLRGPIRSTTGDSPVHFGAENQHAPDLNADSFTNSQTALRAAADGNGLTFAQQVAANLGIDEIQLAAWHHSMNSTASGDPKYRPLHPDLDKDGLPDNWTEAYFEKMPFNAPSFSDWYYRPVYENMVFRNVQIPEGNNGLFINCTFVGVTYVRTRTANTHHNWNLYGRMTLDHVTNKPTPFPPRTLYAGTHPPLMLDPGDIPIMMAEPPLDKADIPDDVRPTISNYNSLPDPLIINNRRVTDTKTLSNNIRFHDCMFVGSIVSDGTTNYTHVRNKFQFTGGTRFVQKHPEHPNDPNLNPRPEHEEEIEKSSMMLPNYSVDIGQFNSPPQQDVRLKGAIVAGVLDIRGNASVDGALLLTFKPVYGQAPFVDATGQPIGNPSLFNATIGYFGPEDGDDESLDPLSLPLYNNERIVGWDLNGDGLADLSPWETPTPAQLAAGAVPVPFYGYGAVTLRFNPNMALPDGILIPLQVEARRGSYTETSK